MSSKQEIYDKVKAHLLTQNAKSYDVENNMCMYRHPDGLKCAIGVLIPDDAYTPDMEGHTVAAMALYDDLWDMFPSFLRETFISSLLSDLQLVHDANDVDQWPAALARVAKAHNLNPNKDTQSK